MRLVDVKAKKGSQVIESESLRDIGAVGGNRTAYSNQGLWDFPRVYLSSITIQDYVQKQDKTENLEKTISIFTNSCEKDLEA